MFEKKTKFCYSGGFCQNPAERVRILFESRIEAAIPGNLKKNRKVQFGTVIGFLFCKEKLRRKYKERLYALDSDSSP